jgi:hypothetical protein
MKKRILALVAVLALVGALVPAIVFAVEGTVTCTVSAFLVSVTVTDGNVAYGALEVGTSESTLDLTDTQTAFNSGTVAEDFNIKSSNATGSSQDWTLVTGTPGNNEFKHEFSIDSGSHWTAMSNSYTSLITDVAATSGSEPFDLRITMPGSTTDYLGHTITVTVEAVQH